MNTLLTAALTSWLCSVLIGALIFAVTFEDRDAPTYARWWLAAIFFGWFMGPILLTCGIAKLYRVAELPSPKTFLRSKRIEREAGQLAVVQPEEGKIVR